MSLKELTIPSASVQTPGGSFSVRGLSLEDLTYILQIHSVEVAHVVRTLESKKDGVDRSLISEMAVGLIESSPAVAAEIIANAADAPDQVAKVRKLPFTTQLDALEKIGDLTFEAYGGPKKVLEVVIRLAKGTTNLLDSLST